MRESLPDQCSKGTNISLRKRVEGSQTTRSALALSGDVRYIARAFGPTTWRRYAEERLERSLIGNASGRGGGSGRTPYLCP